MSEMAKTVVFIAVAAGALLLGFIVKPGEESFNAEEYVGERLNNDFEIEDPKRLKIVKYDSATGTSHEFEVASENGLWTIPSKQGYPADAAEQMAEAATCLIDRQVLKVAATNAGEHNELGVVDPSSSSLGSSAEGVGTRVIMTDTSGAKLVDMIIGKPVKDAAGQRFVRNSDQDIVYVVELNSEKLSTDFEDWIEDDLLQINPLDIREVKINDYSASLQQVLAGGGFQMQVSWDRRAEMALQFDGAESKWSADSLRKFDAEKQEFTNRVLAEDEELNEDVLSELRTGLDDLLLVDVERKPNGLSADLKAGGDFLNNTEAINSLINRGFAPLKVGGEGGDVEILSSEGEVICTMADGVEYVLRFGDLKLDGGTTSDSDADADKAEQDSSEGIHRYLFAMARFNDTVFEKPVLEKLPELPADAVADEKQDAESSAKEEKKDEESKDKEVADEKPAADKEEKAEDEKKVDSEDKKESKADASEEAKESTEKSTEKKTEVSEELQKLIAARKSIETENQRRLDEYQAKIKAGQERVKELNERFGDWYYVISNDVYKQIHLSLDQVIHKKEAPEEEGKASPPAGLNFGNGLPGLPGLPVGKAVGASKADAPKADTAKAEAPPEEKTEAKPAAKSPATESPAAETSTTETKVEPKVEAAADAKAEVESGSE